MCRLKYFWFIYKEEIWGLIKGWKIVLRVWDCVNMVICFVKGMCIWFLMEFRYMVLVFVFTRKLGDFLRFCFVYRRGL